MEAPARTPGRGNGPTEQSFGEAENLYRTDSGIDIEKLRNEPNLVVMGPATATMKALLRGAR